MENKYICCFSDYCVEATRYYCSDKIIKDLPSIRFFAMRLILVAEIFRFQNNRYPLVVTPIEHKE